VEKCNATCVLNLFLEIILPIIGDVMGCAAMKRGRQSFASGDYCLADLGRPLREDGLDRAAWRGLLRSYRA
jgi:hypothetical protein